VESKGKQACLDAFYFQGKIRWEIQTKNAVGGTNLGFLSASDPWTPFWPGNIPHVPRCQKCGWEEVVLDSLRLGEFCHCAVGANVEARVAGREDAGNGDMMSSGDVQCTITTGEGVGPPVQLKGAGEAGVQGSGDTGRSHGMRVGSVPTGTEGVQAGLEDTGAGRCPTTQWRRAAGL
jgi:hypothetical protein